MLSWQQVQNAVKPLRMIFWGGLLWIVDLSFTSTTNGQGFKCDVLDDTVATLLITVALFKLSAVPIPGNYPGAMTAIKVVAILSVIETFIKHFIFPHPPLLAFIFTILGLCQLAATLLFCLAMKWFCDHAGLPQVAASWRVTLLLFSLLNALPIGAIYLLSLLAMVTDFTFHVDLGPAGLLLIPIFAIPLIHLFVSTSRMRRAAESGIATPPPTGAFPVILPPSSSDQQF